MNIRSTTLAAAFLSTLAVHSVTAPVSRAAAPAAAIEAARRDVEIAELELRRYLVVEYPASRKQLESQIAMAYAEIKSNRLLVREYERMSRGKTSQPFLVTLEDARLALLAAELRYDELRDQKSNLEKFHSDQCRLYELRVAAARQRLRSLLAAD